MLIALTAALLLAAALPAAESRHRYVGCFSAPTDLDYELWNLFQSVGLCENRCTRAAQPVAGLTNGTVCLCGGATPPWDQLAEEALCDMPCSGYPRDMCGGRGFFSIYFQEPTARPNETASQQPQHAQPAATRAAVPEGAALRAQHYGGSGL